MKNIVCIVSLILTVFSTQAQITSLPTVKLPPLRVAICRFSPPFIFQADKSEFYGFDIDLIQGICKRIGQECQFTSVPFEEIFTSIEANNADVGLCNITITAERAKRVFFSAPYFPSQSRFIGLAELAKEPFSYALLKDKKIGVETGSIFTLQISTMGIKDAKIVPFPNENAEMESIGAGDIDLALMDAPTARYWQISSNERMKLIGPPMPYGFGYGIAVNKGMPALLETINIALADYLKSLEYTMAYKTYIEEF